MKNVTEKDFEAIYEQYKAQSQAGNFQTNQYVEYGKEEIVAVRKK